MKRREFLQSGGSLVLGGLVVAASFGFSGEPKQIIPYKVLQVRCNGCMHCIRSCRNRVLAMQNGKATIDTAKCTGCGDCVRVCRRQAIIPVST